VKYLIQLVQQVESIETILGLFSQLKICDFFNTCVYSKREIDDGHFVTVTHLKKTIKIDVDVEEDLKEIAYKHCNNDLDHSEQDFKQFTTKLDLVKEEITKLSNKLDLITKQL